MVLLDGVVPWRCSMAFLGVAGVGLRGSFRFPGTGVEGICCRRRPRIYSPTTKHGTSSTDDRLRAATIARHCVAVREHNNATNADGANANTTCRPPLPMTAGYCGTDSRPDPPCIAGPAREPKRAKWTSGS